MKGLLRWLIFPSPRQRLEKFRSYLLLQVVEVIWSYNKLLRKYSLHETRKISSAVPSSISDRLVRCQGGVKNLWRSSTIVDKCSWPVFEESRKLVDSFFRSRSLQLLPDWNILQCKVRLLSSQQHKSPCEFVVSHDGVGETWPVVSCCAEVQSLGKAVERRHKNIGNPAYLDNIVLPYAALTNKNKFFGVEVKAFRH